ncbi:MAG: GAF domain-containing protein [Desulfovibrionaceae bacterium]|nr:GAF domain-containing protein [Desulfovibrionaceae bacterium]
MPAARETPVGQDAPGAPLPGHAAQRAEPARAADASAPSRQILILHSYHRGFTWCDNIARGIDSVLGASGLRMNVFTEYMDSKRFFTEQWWLQLRRLFAEKYAAVRFDCIICTDDNAYRFLLRYQPELFPGCPVVFCGVNSYTPVDIEGRPLFTGLPEIVDIRATLETALRLHPNLQRVYVLVDRTPTGASTRRTLEDALPAFAGRLRFSFLDDMPMREVLRRAALFESGSMVLLLNYNRDGEGRIYSHEETADLLTGVCPVPVYGQWEFQLGHGIVGGKLASGRVQGETAARMALRILEGARPADIPVVVEGADRFVFDYPQLRRFGIRQRDLPPGSQVVNAPKSFYQVNKRYIWSLAALVAFLVVVLLGQSHHILQRRRAQRVLLRVNRALATLGQCNQCLARAQSEGELLRDVCRVIVETGGYELCWVGYAVPGENRLEWSSGWSAEGPARPADLAWCDMRLDRGATGQAWRTGRAGVDVEAPRTGEYRPWYGEPRRRDAGATIALPLREDGEPFGMLRIHAPKAAHAAKAVHASAAKAFDEEEVALLTRLADNLSYGIANQRLSRDRRDALEALRRSNDQLAMLLESLPIVPFTCAGDDPLRITYVGSAVRAVTGYPVSGFLWSRDFWRERVHPDDAEEVLAAFGAPVAGRTVQRRYRFRVADGSYRWFSDTRRLTGEPGDADARVTATWQDVTADQRLRDEAEFRRRQVIQADKLASLGEVVAGVAHEINNPNSFISYNIPLLEETWEVFRPMVEEYAEANPGWSRSGLDIGEYCRDMEGIIDDITAGAARITRVVSSLKEFARGNGQAAPVAVDLNEVVRKAMVIVGAQVRSRCESHVLDLAEGLPAIQGQPLELEQVVANLLVNATHAVARGEGRLAVRTRRVRRLDCVALEVEDNGCGMEPAVLEHVFKPFYTTRRDSGGTGLGLSVSYLLVEEHAGLFCVQSRPGLGTRFTVLLPVARQARPSLLPTLACVGGDAALERRLRTDLAEHGWSVKSVPSVDGLAETLDEHPEIFAVLLRGERDGERLAEFSRARPLTLVGVLGLPGDDGAPLVRPLPLCVDGVLPEAWAPAQMLDFLNRMAKVIV